MTRSREPACATPRGRGHSTGASLVEFALVAPLFFFLIWALFSGIWYVLEVSAVTNAAREAASWEVAASNFIQVTGPAPTYQTYPGPYCMYSGSTGTTVDPTDSTNGLVAAAAATAGPFAQEVMAAEGSGNISNTPNAASDTCTVTITIPYTPLEAFVRIGPSTITASSTAYWTIPSVSS